ncbi:hypothetical protein MBM_03754 [Drepanopeziza brunnea f. sp. 'multigermtubi' MB_m1]|uniref:Uncharacterized protein n=1 Tax=Marssonina brunnea f. sp. multigermtubi (strain MB_m1) TaxID=1072389 RepID=K1WZB4_MARBU|nr:uncharacterized protein MBM_03754 [Drepanopeziza brunnea f. sp. 'multigermtubi' MB_m1]EKD17982.1 hypothetical protein MBM_03754 [Drepanopeziza brunnea f. sp. 'multigermtubi' MB_m1]
MNFNILVICGHDSLPAGAEADCARLNGDGFPVFLNIVKLLRRGCATLIRSASSIDDEETTERQTETRDEWVADRLYSTGTGTPFFDFSIYRYLLLTTIFDFDFDFDFDFFSLRKHRTERSRVDRYGTVLPFPYTRHVIMIMIVLLLLIIPISCRPSARSDKSQVQSPQVLVQVPKSLSLSLFELNTLSTYLSCSFMIFGYLVDNRQPISLQPTVPTYNPLQVSGAGCIASRSFRGNLRTLRKESFPVGIFSGSLKPSTSLIYISYLGLGIRELDLNLPTCADVEWILDPIAYDACAGLYGYILALELIGAGNAHVVNYYVEGIQKPMPQNDQETTSPIADGNDEIDNQDRPLILYVYADGNGSTPLDNLKFFLAHGIHNAADFVFIVNGKTEADVAGMILRENKEGNIRVIKRPNDCYDLGGLASVLLNDDLYKGYKYFITMNASIRGPFLPYWSDACWTDRFLSKVTDKVKLVGITANCWPTFHIQSMIWATDIIGLETLLFPPQSALDFLAQNPVKHIPGPYKDMAEYAEADEEKKKELDLFYAREANETVAINHQPPGINSCFHSWRAAVAGEVSSTALIRAAGYEVDALMNAYHGLESEEYEKGKTCYDNRDLLFDGAYFGINVHPFETVFLKANRGLAPLTLEKHTEWANKRNYSSYDYCKS